jgi:hypothetical protein
MQFCSQQKRILIHQLLKTCLGLISLVSAFFLNACNQSSPSLMEAVPAHKSNIHFANLLDTSKSYRILYFFYYYNGGGVATGDVNNDGLTDIYFTSNNKGANKLYLNKGNFVFEDITDQAGVAGNSDWCTGVTMADVNADGFLDIYVLSVNNVYNFKGRNELFINNGGNGTFTESADQYGLGIAAFANQASFFDYDHDGDLDCYLLNQSFKPAENVVDTSNRRKFDPNAGDRLLRNDLNSTGTFTDVSAEAGIYQSSLGYGLGIAVADINNDGWEDIYVGNDFHENDYYYVNNKNGTFTESGAKHFRHYSRFSMGNDIADYNNDGHPDIFTTDMLPAEEKILKTYGSGESPDVYNYIITRNGFQSQYSKNCLHRNNGNGVSFSDVSLISGVSATDWSWSPLFADFNNDGNKDLFISTGIPKRTVDMDYIRFISNLYIPPGTDPKEKYNEALAKIPDGASHNYLFIGNGRDSFTDASALWGLTKQIGYFTGAAYADFDNDGDLDMVVNNVNNPAVIYKNNTRGKNYISVSFSGDNRNTKGIGVKTWVFSNGKMQYQQLMTTRGFQSSSEPRMHFGIDTASAIDSMLVVWNDGRFQMLENLAVNRSIVISQKNASGSFNYTSFFYARNTYFTNVSADFTVEWKHAENDFFDFNIQALIPHGQSARGPRTAVADVNKDGLDDFYVCGAKGQPGALFVQQKNSKFTSVNQELFLKEREREEVAAIFFDANNDSYPDLYISSGGNEYPNGNPLLTDRLYFNDCKGGFKLSAGSIPALATNKSCVAVADINQDGAMDLFVGVLADPLNFGLPQSSYLLVNDGKGNFSEVKDEIISLRNIGMITDAVFADIDNDNWQDLIVAGEWMPLKIFRNKKGKFSQEEVPVSSGLWQCLMAADVNGDGFVDILSGNWGLNSKLSAGKSAPLKLYIKDFDNNKVSEQVLSYTINQKDYCFLVKDELEKAIPVLKKTFLSYSDAAGKTVEEMFPGMLSDAALLKAELLESSCFINNEGRSFTRTALPFETQLAPLMCFSNMDGKNMSRFIAAGNFYSVLPYEGRYDAMIPVVFEFDHQKKRFKELFNLPFLTGEIRDIKLIKCGGESRVMLIAQNNGRLIFLQDNL